QRQRHGLPPVKPGGGPSKVPPPPPSTMVIGPLFVSPERRGPTRPKPPRVTSTWSPAFSPLVISVVGPNDVPTVTGVVTRMPEIRWYTTVLPFTVWSARVGTVSTPVRCDTTSDTSAVDPAYRSLGWPVIVIRTGNVALPPLLELATMP